MNEQVLATIQEEWNALFNQHRLPLVMAVREELITLFEQMSPVEVSSLQYRGIRCEFDHSMYGKTTLAIYLSASGSSVGLYVGGMPWLGIKYLSNDVQYKKENLTDEKEIQMIKHFIASWYHICKEHLERQQKEK